MQIHSVQEVIANGNTEIEVDTRIRTSFRNIVDRPDRMIYNETRKGIVLIEVEIASRTGSGSTMSQPTNIVRTTDAS